MHKTVMQLLARFLGLHVFVLRVCKMTGDIICDPEIEGLEMRVITPDELRASCNDQRLLLDPAFVEPAIERGDVAVGGFVDGELVAYAWRSTTAAPHTQDLWVRVGKPYCYSYKSFTRPTWRGRRLGPALLNFSDKVMLGQGFTHRAGFIATTNFPNLEATKYMRCEIVGRSAYIAIFGRFANFSSRGIKETGFEFFRPGETSSTDGD